MRDMSLRKVLSLPATKPADELVPGSILYLQKGQQKELNIACFDESGVRPGKAVRDYRITGPGTLYQSAPGASVEGVYKIANFDSFTTYTVSVSRGTVSVVGDTITVTPPTTPGKVYLSVNGEHSVITIKPPAVLPPHITYPQTGMSFIDSVSVQLSAFATSGPEDAAAVTKWQVSKDPLFEVNVSETITDGDDLTQTLMLPEAGTTYYIRGMRVGVVLGDSEWSDVVSVTTRLESLLVSETSIISPTVPYIDGYFGGSLSFANDSSELIVCSRKGFGTNQGVGGFYLYDKDASGVWHQISSLSVTNTIASDLVGTNGSISEDGKVFATGIPVFAQHATGAVVVFRKMNGVWSEEALLLPEILTNIAQFGFSVSLSKGGTHLMVGAPGSYSGNGRVFIFEYVNDAWVQKAVLAPDSEVVNEYYGTSVYLNASASMGIVGSINHAPVTPLTKTGCGYLYSRDETTWSLERKLYTPDATAGSLFGTAVMVNDAGTEAYVAGVGRLINGVASGSVKVYNKFYPVPWSEMTELTPSVGHVGQNFGCSLAINAAGTRLIVGACGEDTQGAIYVYDRTQDNWSFTNKRKASIPRANSQFGSEVDISKNGTEVYIGSRGDSEVQTHSGKVYHFK